MVLLSGHQIAQQLLELGRIGSGHRRQGIERCQDQALLLVGQIDVGDRYGRLAPGDGELDTQVAIDQMSGALVDDDLGDPAHLGKGTGEGSLLLRWVSAPVSRVGDEAAGRLLAVADDAGAPGGCVRAGGSCGRGTGALHWNHGERFSLRPGALEVLD
jgi:hypothetical protein